MNPAFDTVLSADAETRAGVFAATAQPEVLQLRVKGLPDRPLASEVVIRPQVPFVEEGGGGRSGRQSSRRRGVDNS